MALMAKMSSNTMLDAVEAIFKPCTGAFAAITHDLQVRLRAVVHPRTFLAVLQY